MLAVGCTSLPNVDVVARMDGRCAIGKFHTWSLTLCIACTLIITDGILEFSLVELCIQGFVHHAANNTCVAV